MSSRLLSSQIVRQKSLKPLIGGVVHVEGASWLVARYAFEMDAWILASNPLTLVALQIKGVCRTAYYRVLYALLDAGFTRSGRSEASLSSWRDLRFHRRHFRKWPPFP